MNRTIIKIILVVAVAVFAGAALMFGYTIQEYKKGEKEYGEVAKNAVIHNEKPDVSAEQSYSSRLFKAGIPDLKVDFDRLSGENPDVIGWIYEPVLEISYPVVMGEDDEYYLHHTFLRESNSAGCIFAGCEAKKDFTSYNTFIYGHNMKNGTMFGKLKYLLRDKEIQDKFENIYLYTAGSAIKYKVYSYYVTPPDSDTYNIIDNENEYEDYKKMAVSDSIGKLDISIPEKATTITLSTCTGSGNNKKRFVVHAYEAERIINNNK